MNRNSILALALLLALGAGLWFFLSGPSGADPALGAGGSAAGADPAAGALTDAGQDPAAGSALSRSESAAGAASGAYAELPPGSAELILLARDSADRPVGKAWATAVEDQGPSDLPAGVRLPAFGGAAGTPPAQHAADAQGRIRIPVPVGQRLQVEVASPDHQSKYLSLQPLASGESLDLGPVALLAGAQVAGRVLDPEGQAVAGARVALRAAERGGRGFSFGGGRNADTAADGSFSFSGVEPGSYVLEAEARGFAPARGESAAKVTAKAGAAPAEAVLRLQAGRVLQGMVVDPDRRPIAGAEVFLRSPLRGGGFSIVLPGGGRTSREPDAVTDSAGRFSLRGVEAGSGSRVSARASGYGLAWASADANAAELLIQLKPALSFGGSLLSPEGQAVAGAELRLERVEDEEEGFNFRSLFDDHSATTDAQGRFLIDGLDPGVWAIAASAGSASSSGQRVDLKQDVLDAVVRLAPASVLAVSVARSLDGAPLADALVSLSPAAEQTLHGAPGRISREVRVSAGGPRGPQVSYGGGDGQSLRTGADGIASFADLPEGRYDLEVRADGYATHDTVLVRERGPQELAVSLLPGADLRVTVQDGAGVPLPGVEVIAKPADPALAGKAQPQTRRTDDSGRSIFAGLAPGAWTVDYRAAAAPAGFVFAGPNSRTEDGTKQSHTEVPAMLVPGDALEVVLQATGLCLPTAVVSRRGAALAGAEVRLEALQSEDAFRMPSFGGGTRTDANGKARLQPSEPGSYELVINPGNGLPERREQVELTAGPQELEVDVRGGRISGLVLADGRAPANATARLEEAPAADAGSSPNRPRSRVGIAITVDDSGGGGGAMTFGGGPSTSAQVDGSGRFSFEEVPPGEYVVRVSANGFAGWTSERIVLTENQEREIGTAALVSGGVIRGVDRRAVNAEAGFGNILILMDATGNQAGFAQPGPGGAYEFKDLATGTYTIMAPPGYNSDPIEVKAGQTVTFDVPAN